MAEVRHYKLIGGEEIIGTVKDDKGRYGPEGFIILEKVRVLMAQPMGQGQVGIGMIPYMMGNPDGAIKIPKDMIIGTPVDGNPKNLEDSYLQQVSGLAFATAANTGAIQT